MAKTCGCSETSLRLERHVRSIGTRGITEGVPLIFWLASLLHHGISPLTALLCVCSFGPRKSFQYLTPRLRITPRDLLGTSLSHPATIHFICSPTRAAVIMSQVAEDEGWSPISIYEPIPVRMVPVSCDHHRTVPPTGQSESHST
jgi:hypothetical protein